VRSRTSDPDEKVCNAYSVAEIIARHRKTDATKSARAFACNTYSVAENCASPQNRRNQICAHFWSATITALRRFVVI
jgi:hypothetical protein